jgi:uncharacterized protein (DUF1499 family)
MQIVGYIVGGLAALVILQFVALWVGVRVVKRPENVNTGELAPCPNSPNCVCTEATDKQHAIAMIPFTGTPAQAKATLVSILEELPKTTIITNVDGYVYAEARSPMMSFVDDMDFVIDADQSAIRFRSAARLGKGDLGKNRERMEHIRTQFAARQDQETDRARADTAYTV